MARVGECMTFPRIDAWILDSVRGQHNMLWLDEGGAHAYA